MCQDFNFFADRQNRLLNPASRMRARGNKMKTLQPHTWAEPGTEAVCIHVVTLVN